MVSVALFGIIVVGQATSSKRWDVLSEDGKFAATINFGIYRDIVQQKDIKGEYVLYTTDGSVAKAVTTSQRARGAGLDSVNNEILHSAAWSSSVWMVAFREWSHRARALPSRATTKSLWVSIIYPGKRGRNPNVGMRVLTDFATVRLVPVGPSRVLLTGWKWKIVDEPSRILDYSYTCLDLDFEKMSSKALWTLSRRGSYSMMADHTGVLFVENRKLKYYKASTKQTRIVNESGLPVWMAGGLAFYPGTNETRVRNLSNNKVTSLREFVATGVNGQGTLAVGMARGSLATRKVVAP